MSYLSTIKEAPDFLRTPASRRAYAFNEGFRLLVSAESVSPQSNYATWLYGRAEQFVQAEDYPIAPCECFHAPIVEGAREKGSPILWCHVCGHLVRFSFMGNPIHCEADI
jgi:hypothetical protein